MRNRGKPEHSLMDDSSTIQVEKELLLPDCGAELGARLKALLSSWKWTSSRMSGVIQSGAQMSYWKNPERKAVAACLRHTFSCKQHCQSESSCYLP